MSWKTTLFLGVTALLVGVAVLLWKNDGPPPDAVRADFLPGIEAHQVNRISISSSRQVEILLEREGRAGSNTWNLLSPVQKIANEYLVMEMLRGLFQARKSPFVRPGEESYSVAKSGFDGTGLSVKLQTDSKTVLIRFGSPSKLQPNRMWVQVAEDPKIYLVANSLFDLFQKEIGELRSKRIAGFETHRVTKIHLQRRYPELKGGEQVETSLIERRDSGWYLTEPFEERLDDAQVNALLGGLAGLVAEDFLSVRTPGEHGTDRPEFRCALEYAEGKKKFVYHLGKFVDDRARRYVWTDPVDEVAIVAVDRYLEQIPQMRNSFRAGRVIDWSPADAKRIEIDYHGVGKISLVPVQEANRAFWLPENPGHPYDREKSTKLGFGLFTLSLKDDRSWLGVQPDQEKALGLDPPQVTLRFVLNSGERVFFFALDDSGEAYMKKEWQEELYMVPSHYVKILQLLDLNYRTLDLWSVRVDQVTGFLWEKRILGRNPEFWSIVRRRDPETEAWKWNFSDPESTRSKLVVDWLRARELLVGLSQIQAKKFVTKSPAIAKRFELDGTSPPYRLVLSLGTEGEEKTLLVSRNWSKAGAAPLYFARFEDDPIVFQIDATLIDLLIQGLVKEE